MSKKPLVLKPVTKPRTLGGDQLILLPEAAELCRVPVSTVRHWIAEKVIPSVRPGRHRMIWLSDLHAMLKRENPLEPEEVDEEQPPPRGYSSRDV